MTRIALWFALVVAACCLLAAATNRLIEPTKPTQETPVSPSVSPVPPLPSIPHGSTHDCSQLRSLSYPELVDYWTYLGSPSDMDADRDGIPCEENFSADTK